MSINGDAMVAFSTVLTFRAFTSIYYPRSLHLQKSSHKMANKALVIVLIAMAMVALIDGKPANQWRSSWSKPPSGSQGGNGPSFGSGGSQGGNGPSFGSGGSQGPSFGSGNSNWGGSHGGNGGGFGSGSHGGNGR